MYDSRGRSLPKLTIIPAGHAAVSLQKMLPKKVIWEASSDMIHQLSEDIHTLKTPAFASLDDKSKQLITSIKDATFKLNKNNITRTTAYLSFFENHREIEWSFLAHMVSRNAGYYMTDLKGEFLPRLLSEEERYKWFLFLEHSNYMIFHDAFPQLLLYAESKTKKTPFFHLLPHFGVSKLMVPVWNAFFNNRNLKEFLTLFLIINEQKYIEERIVTSMNHGMLLQSSAFKWQETLHISQILLFDGKKLYGCSANKFNSWKDRVSLGGSLYAILFSPEKFDSFFHYALNIPHTGSRADYDSHLYSADIHFSNSYLKERIRFFTLKRGASKLLSPYLKNAWPLTDRPLIKMGDWYSEMNDVKGCLTICRPFWQQMQHAYFSSLHKLELSVLAHEWMKKT